MQTIVCLKQIVADLLNRPLGIDAVRLDLIDDAVDKEAILEHQQMCVDEERRLMPAVPFQLRLHSLQLIARLLDGTPKSLDLFSDLIRFQFEVERYEHRIKGA